jgi:hypothetical protein
LPIFDELSSEEEPVKAPPKKASEKQLDPMELKPCAEEIEIQLEKSRI